MFLNANRMDDGFTMSLQANNKGGLALGTSSPCVWPNGTPAPATWPTFKSPKSARNAVMAARTFAGTPAATPRWSHAGAGVRGLPGLCAETPAEGMTLSNHPGRGEHNPGRMVSIRLDRTPRPDGSAGRPFKSDPSNPLHSHSEYWDPGSSSLREMGKIVAGKS